MTHPALHPDFVAQPYWWDAAPPEESRDEPLPARAHLAFRLETDEWQGVRRVRLLVEGAAG